jgi:hypothetical protein
MGHEAAADVPAGGLVELLRVKSPNVLVPGFVLYIRL